jgi:hypothetical protein
MTGSEWREARDLVSAPMGGGLGAEYQRRARLATTIIMEEFDRFAADIGRAICRHNFLDGFLVLCYIDDAPSN